MTGSKKFFGEDETPKSVTWGSTVLLDKSPSKRRLKRTKSRKEEGLGDSIAIISANELNKRQRDKK